MLQTKGLFGVPIIDASDADAHDCTRLLSTATAVFPAIQCRSGSSAKSAQAMPAEMAGTQNRVETGSNNCKQEHTLFLYCFDYELFVKMS